jgi:lysozyme
MSETTGTVTEGATEELEGSNVQPDVPEGEPTDEAEPSGSEEAGTPEVPEERGISGGLSSHGAEFVARFEGCILRLYDDPTNNATIGIGHLVHMGPINGSEPSEFRQGITRQRALQLLQHDAAAKAAAVHRLITVPLNQQQVDALISFTFNVGEGNLQASTLRRKLNARDYGSVPSELQKWTLSAGQRLPGLVRRRQAEGTLFAHGRYA